MSYAVGTSVEGNSASFFRSAFSSFAVTDLAAARHFYTNTLGVNVLEQKEGLELKIAGAGNVFLYPKPDHTAATFTVLNFEVDDIEKAVAALTEKGVRFEAYTGELQTDAQGIFRGGETGNGPNIAWFKDPSGNILSVAETKRR